MTLYDLQKVLGENIHEINDKVMEPEERKLAFEKADMVSRLAKQMICNADVILRTDKLIASGQLREQTIVKVIGGDSTKTANGGN